MSNSVYTNFKVCANEYALKKLKSIKESINDAQSFAQILGDDEYTGAKWANFVDIDDDRVTLESGNNLPDIALNNLYKILCEFDPNIQFLDGEYWEQNYLEVGVFELDNDGFRFVSTSIGDVDIEEEFAFETYVNPVLEKLKKDL